MSTYFKSTHKVVTMNIEMHISVFLNYVFLEKLFLVETYQVFGWNISSFWLKYIKLLVEIYQLASFAMCDLFGGKSGQMVRGGCNCKQKADLHILPQIGPIFSFFLESFSKTKSHISEWTLMSEKPSGALKLQILDLPGNHRPTYIRHSIQVPCKTKQMEPKPKTEPKSNNCKEIEFKKYHLRWR